MKTISVAGVMAALALAGAGCGKNNGAAPFDMVVKVRATEATVQPVEEKISLVASIYANEVVDIKSEMDGRIEVINFQEGQVVTQGQLLVKLDQQKLEASVRQAEANFKLAEANRQRAETMLNNKTISLQEYDQAISSFEANRATLELVQQQLKDSHIVAPFSGIAGARLVSPGQVISRDTRLTTLVDIVPVKIEFSVPERYIGQLREGQTVEFRVAAYPGESFQGEVYFIAPQVDTATRTVLVKALQPNTDGRLRPGMFGNLDLILRIKERAVLAPESAIVHEGDKTSLFIIDADNHAQRMDVQLGIRLAGQVEITEGLHGGERVIYEGIQKVFPGVKVMTGDQQAAPPAT